MTTNTSDKLLEGGIYITTNENINKGISVVISVLSEDELKENNITDTTFVPRFPKWHKIVAEPNNPASLSKYYGLVHMLITNYIKSNKNIILHSTEDQVRAAHLFIIYLILANKWSVEMAINYLKRVKPEINLPYENIIELMRFYDNMNIQFT